MSGAGLGGASAVGRPQRADLGFLRHRARPRRTAAVDLAPVDAPLDAAPLAPLDLAPVDLAPPVGAPPARRPTRTPLPPLLPGLPLVAPGARRVLTADEPVVQLDRVLSGVGGLRVAVETTHALGVAVLYELGGRQGVVRGPSTSHAPDHRHPVLTVTGLRVQLDLRRVGDLARLLVTVRAPAGAEAGVLTVATVGGARLEVPLGAARRGTRDGDAGTRAPAGAGDVTVDHAALSVHRVRGGLVLRAEGTATAGGLREAARAYGYGSITWRDPDTPLV